MNILVRLPNWLGDVVMSLTFLQELARLQPDSHIEVIIKKELAEIPALLPFVKQIHPFSKKEFPGISGVYRFGKKLSENKKYDYFFCLPDSFSSAMMGLGIQARKRIGFSGQWRSFLLTHAFAKPQHLHRTEEYLYLLEKTFQTKIQASAFRFPAVEKKEYMILNFNSEASSRRMPVSKALEIIKYIRKEFSQPLVLIGSLKEQIFIESILNLLPERENIENLAGKTTLPELIQTIASAILMISTDSGSAHIATAVQTPLLVLFGAGNEANTGPFQTEKAKVLRLEGLPCSPCLKNECKLYKQPKCLTDIPVQNIVDEVKKLV
ncbi:MAG: lipopolysaccharide heptosyltransferase II [Verrucomicrobia bacterium]|nr:lipopolysaccharide heptosyltransferase II [Cytophagales bacterium]